MRVLLLDPGAVGSSDWGQLQTTKLALLSLYSFLRANAPEVSVEICDLEMELVQPADEGSFARYREDMRQWLSELEFDVLAISCWTSLKYRTAVSVAEIARDLHPDAVIVVGGYHPSAMPSDFAYPDSPFDHVVQGEGEHELLRIVRGMGGTISVGKPRAVQESYRMRWEEYPLYDEAEFQFPILFSRGCPFACNFCMEPFTKGRTWRPLPVDTALERLDDLVAHRPAKYITIQDPLFGANARWRDAMLRALIDREFSKLMWAMTRSDIWSPESLAMVGQLNFMLDFGVETASPEMISIMNKAANPERYLRRTAETLQAAGAAGVASSIYLITHHPGERLRHVRETLGFFRELFESSDALGIAVLCAQKFMYFPGTNLDHSDEFQRRFGTVITKPAWWKKPGPLFDNAACVIDANVSPDERAEIDALWKSGLAELNQLAIEKISVQAHLKIRIMRSELKRAEAARKAAARAECVR